MTGSHEVRGSIPLGSTNYLTLFRFGVSLGVTFGAETALWSNQLLRSLDSHLAQCELM